MTLEKVSNKSRNGLLGASNVTSDVEKCPRKCAKTMISL
jgi:hypothetical protein